MIQLTARERLALRLCAAGMSLLIALQVLAPRAQAEVAPVQPAAAVAQTASLQLFSESRMETRDRFSVEVVGHGPDVVLVPGLASSRETFRRTAQSLRGRYRLHLVQIAGFAGEPARANAAGPLFDPLVEALDHYITEQGLKRPAVIGHSLGGALGLALAERHPEHVGRLMIVDSLPFFGVLVAGPSATPAQIRPLAEAMGQRTLAMAPEAFATAQAAAFRTTMVKDPADLARIVQWSLASDRGVMVRAMEEDFAEDLRPDLGKVRAPVTVLCESALQPLVQSGYAPLAVKTLTPVPDALHFIMYDQPQAFDAAVETFLAGAGRA